MTLVIHKIKRCKMWYQKYEKWVGRIKMQNSIMFLNLSCYQVNIECFMGSYIWDSW